MSTEELFEAYARHKAEAERLDAALSQAVQANQLIYQHDAERTLGLPDGSLTTLIARGMVRCLRGKYLETAWVEQAKLLFNPKTGFELSELKVNSPK
jgi:hypothetical protein